MVDVPVLMQPAFRHSVLVPLVQFLDRLLDIPVLPQIGCRKLWRLRSCRSSGSRAMLGSTVDSFSASARGRFFCKEFQVFPRVWEDSVLEIDSRPTLIYEPCVFSKSCQQSRSCAGGFFGSPRWRRVLRCRLLGGWRGRRKS